MKGFRTFAWLFAMTMISGCAGSYKRDTLPAAETMDPFGGLIDHQNAIIQIIF